MSIMDHDWQLIGGSDRAGHPTSIRWCNRCGALMKGTYAHTRADGTLENPTVVYCPIGGTWTMTRPLCTPQEVPDAQDNPSRDEAGGDVPLLRRG